MDSSANQRYWKALRMHAYLMEESFNICHEGIAMNPKVEQDVDERVDHIRPSQEKVVQTDTAR